MLQNLHRDRKSFQKRVIMVYALVIFLSLPKNMQSFGQTCKQIINEHLFDLQDLTAPKDYFFAYKDPQTKTDTELFFNFCRSTTHSCPDTESEYSMMATTSSSCRYYKTVNDDAEYGRQNEGNMLYLISRTGKQVSEDIPADGIGGLYQEISGTQNYIKLNVYCSPSSPVLKLVSSDFRPYKGKSILVLEYESAISCPRKISVMFFNVLDDLKWVLFAIGLVLGPLQFILGFKLFRLTLVLISFLISFIVSNWLLHFLFVSPSTAKFWGYFLIVVSVFIGLLVGYIVKKIYKIGLVSAGVAAGFFVSLLLNVLVLWRLESNPSSVKILFNLNNIFLGFILRFVIFLT